MPDKKARLATEEPTGVLGNFTRVRRLHLSPRREQTPPPSHRRRALFLCRGGIKKAPGCFNQGQGLMKKRPRGRRRQPKLPTVPFGADGFGAGELVHRW